MNTKKFALALVLAAAVCLLVPAAAFANFAIHGNYVTDTDACAGCHRAHTSVSSITWTANNNTQVNALLVTSATEMWQFCYACHDSTSQGADTNVQTGIYEGTLYGTQNGNLNGGGFEEFGGTAVTSTHMYKGSSWGAYGGGYFGSGETFDPGNTNAGQGPNAYMNGTGNAIKMDCTSCHDPHGSPNYRILKTMVNGNTVGQYGPGLGSGGAADPDPNGYVSSVETGWPVNGFRLHTAYPAYSPDYTTARYAKGYNMTAVSTATPAADLNTGKGMSGWCEGCHTTYLGPIETFTKTNQAGIESTYASVATTYNAGDGGGLALRHKHPINVEMDAYQGPDKSSMIITDTTLPLAHAINERGTQTNQGSDWIECLTCHRAHGTAANMTGWASNAGAASIMDVDGIARNNFVAMGAVPSALLRYDNRGVCERCHNK
jgi:predicted CXXCH cytochrome family protein